MDGTGADRIKLTDPTFHDTLYPIQVNNWWGHMNQRGRLIVRPRFDWSDHSYEGLARVVVDGQTGFIKGNGDWWVEPDFAYADRFAEGFAVVGQGRWENVRYGFIDKRGKLRVSIQFNGVLRFHDGLAAVQAGDHCGFINTRGQVAIDVQFLRVRSFHEGLAMVQYADPKAEAGPLAYINKRGKRVFLDREGRFADLGDFNESLAKARVGDHWGYIGKRFRIRIDPQFDDARDFTGGLAAVSLQGKWGYIDKKGRWAIPPGFEAADDLDESLAMVKLDGAFGFVDRTGRLRIEPRFDNAEPFFRRLAMVMTEGGLGYVDVSGRWVWDPRDAKEGFVDVTLKETATIGKGSREGTGIGNTPGPGFHLGNRVKTSPAIRPPAPLRYPPEHLYDEELPRKPALEERKKEEKQP